MTSDIIVGFPGETEEDFQQTLDLLAKVRFSTLFAFVYSPRPGTAAERIEDDVPLAVKKARLYRVQGLQREITDAWMADFLGRDVEVLFEGPSTLALKQRNERSITGQLLGPPQLMGRSPENLKVNVETRDPSALMSWPGRLATVKIDKIGKHSLHGSSPRFT